MSVTESQFDLDLLTAQFLGNREVIAFSPPLARAIGDVEATVFLCQACYWQTKAGAARWFYKLRDADRENGRMIPPSNSARQSWEWETGLSRTRQESARRKLKALGLLEEVLQDVPARLYYRVNLRQLTAFYLAHVQLAGNDPSSWQDFDQPAGRDKTSKAEQRPPANTETTSEIINTTTPDIQATDTECGIGDGSFQPSGLAVEKSVAVHRDLLNQLLIGLPMIVGQQIADELAGALEAGTAGTQRRVENVRGWLTAVIRKQRNGEFVPDLGRSIVARRQRAHADRSSMSERDRRPKPELVEAELNKIIGLGIGSNSRRQAVEECQKLPDGG